MKVSTASDSEPDLANGLLLEPRSLPLAVLTRRCKPRSLPLAVLTRRCNMKVSTASDSERDLANGLLLEPRSLPLAVLTRRCKPRSLPLAVLTRRCNMKVSTASGSERDLANGLLLEPRSLPLAVLTRRCKPRSLPLAVLTRRCNMKRKRNIYIGAAFLSLIVALGVGQSLLDKATTVQGGAVVMAPRFEMDPLWPKPLPNNWYIGMSIGVGVDAQDHVWIVHRPDSLSANEAAADQKTGACCSKAPPVLEFDQAGNLIGH